MDNRMLVWLALALASPVALRAHQAPAFVPAEGACWALRAQRTPAFLPAEGDYVIKDFRFSSGESLPELRLHYATFGHSERNARGMTRNAVLILHGTGGSGRQFLCDVFAGVLFGPGQLLDTARYYVILPDGIGHGRSSKPSDGLHARFPHYTYDDMVQAHYRLLTEHLGVNHLRLVMGTSMGGMQTWVWGGDVPRLHGRPDAAGEPAGRDRGPQPHAAEDDPRRDPHRPHVAERRIHRSAACGDDCPVHPYDHGECAVAMAEGGADAPGGRQLPGLVHPRAAGGDRRQ